jgi:hypothetical protein
MAREAVETMGNELGAELAELRAAVDRLEQGLRLMLETQATHSEMLREILQAAAVPVEPETPLTGVLAGLIAAMNEQQAELKTIGAVMQSLPADVGAAVGAAIRGGLKEI